MRGAGAGAGTTVAVTFACPAPTSTVAGACPAHRCKTPVKYSTYKRRDSSFRLAAFANLPLPACRFPAPNAGPLGKPHARRRTKNTGTRPRSRAVKRPEDSISAVKETDFPQ